ncbi:MAG TPA: NfeD family protein [Chryseolinea sp.]|nr:NfeD family protein [Chryseolinea sp.]
MEFFENLDPFLRAFWFVAIPTSLIFAVQTVMTFIGVDATDGLEADFDSDLSGGDAPFQLFSVRNLINFLLGFSWSGVSFYKSISNPVILISISFAIGAAFVALFFVIIRQIQKLAEDNSFKLSNTLNKTAEVYLPIPENKKGLGKVIISVNGSVHELGAMTEGIKIESGSVVKVIRIESNSILIVEKI